MYGSKVVPHESELATEDNNNGRTQKWLYLQMKSYRVASKKYEKKKTKFAVLFCQCWQFVL